VAVLVGFGDFPGIANFFARRGADSMDQAEEITVATTAGMRTRIGAAAMNRVWHNTFAGPAIVWQNGRYLEVEARREKELIELPGGGSYEVMLARLSQAVTLPRHIHGLRRAVCKAGLGSKELGNDILCTFFDWGMNSPESIEVKGVKVAPVDFAIAFLESDAHAQAIGIGRQSTHGGNMVRVTGLKKGKPARYMCTYIDAGMVNTERTCALAATMLADGSIRQAGVLAPEALDPTPFIHHAALAGTIIREETSQYM
jgi:saccharopine dehydrogenase-like NADP-dependent oxidoreductase